MFSNFKIYGPNVLLSSSGRRNYLIQYFKQAWGNTGGVFAADTNKTASTLQESDKAFVVPPVTAPDYLERILMLCKENNVGLIVPLNDLELPILAKNKQILMEAGIFPFVSSAEVIDVCFNKFQTHSFFHKLQLNSPRTYKTLKEAQQAISAKELRLPVVVKPCFGSGSLGIYTCHDLEELSLSWHLLLKQLEKTVFGTHKDKIIVQEFCRGDEFGLDIINDLYGNHITTIVRKKLVMRAGETDRAIVIESTKLKELGTLIATNLKHIGNLDCDVFWNGHDLPSVLEMNPRFGGGYPFSHEAGVNLPKMIWAWLHNEVASPDLFTPIANQAFAKCDRLVKIKDV